MTIRRRMQQGETLTGTFVQVTDPAAVEFLGRLGFDLLCVEGEHSAMGAETVQRLVAAAGLSPVPAIVRVADNTPQAIAAALDAGAQGVLVPRVSSAAEAAAAVRAARYPPLGLRGLGPSRATGYGADIPGYLGRANDELLLAIQIETRAALECLQEMLAVDHLDMAFVGPGDLACSLGIDDPRSPHLKDAISMVIASAREAGLLTGVFAASGADAAHWQKEGVDLVILGSDLMWLARGVDGTLAELREAA